MLTVNRLSIDDARLLIEGARRKAREIEVPMCIAVCDESGNLIAFERMDGGKILSVTLAQNKALTAAMSRNATAFYNEKCVPGNLAFGIHTAQEGRFCIVGGGVPVRVESAVVGGIGVSSGTPEQDIECAEGGIAYWQAEAGS